MSQLTTSLSLSSKYEAFYTGGNVSISNDGNFLFCTCGEKVSILDVDTSKIHSYITQESEQVTSFCLSPDDKFLVIATQAFLLRKWDWREKSLICAWKSMHRSAVMSLTFNPSSTLLASGGSDSLVKVWDTFRRHCTHNFCGHTGVVSLVCFHPDLERQQLLSAAADCTVRVWSLLAGTCCAVIRDHYTCVKDICFSADGNTVYSCGGDKVVCVWNMAKLSVVMTIPVFEGCEAVMMPSSIPGVHDEEIANHIVLVGSDGSLKVVNVKSGSCILIDRSYCNMRTDDLTVDTTEPTVVQAFYCRVLQKFVMVTAEQNIILLNEDFSLCKQLCGHLEEVLDVGVLGEDGSHLAVVTNSRKVKVFSRHTMQCRLLSGHTDNIMAVTTSRSAGGRLFATASKDCTIRVWRMDPETEAVMCIAVGDGHTSAVNTVAFSQLNSDFVVSGSKDETMKLWPISEALKCGEKNVTKLHAQVTKRAHEDEIHFVTVAPNDKFVASSSKDKTAKIWSIPDFSLVGSLKHHRRAVLCVQFSPKEQCLATASADGTICLWDLRDMSCLQTFEGHDSSVLRVIFINGGRQLLSSDSEGLLKLWVVSTKSCVKTVAAHEGKVWALAADPTDKFFFSGATDSTVILWKDTTEEEIKEAKDKVARQLLLEQTLSNYVKDKKFLKAIGLTLTLDQPSRLLSMLKDILREESGYADLTDAFCRLKPLQLGLLLGYASRWNSNTRNCRCAQVVVNIVLKNFTVEELVGLPEFNSSLEGLIPYTERHYQRANHLEQSALFARYSVKCQKPFSNMDLSGCQTE